MRRRSWTTAAATSREGIQSSSNTSDRESQLQERSCWGDPRDRPTVALEGELFPAAKEPVFRFGVGEDTGSDIELARKGGAETTRLDSSAR